MNKVEECEVSTSGSFPHISSFFPKIVVNMLTGFSVVYILGGKFYLEKINECTNKFYKSR